MIVLVDFFLSSIIGTSILKFTLPNHIKSHWEFIFGSLIGISFSTYLFFILQLFQSISYWLLCEHLLIIIFLSFLIKFKFPLEKPSFNFQAIVSNHFILFFQFLIIFFYSNSFPDHQSFHVSSNPQILSDFSLAASIAYGCNTNGRPYSYPYFFKSKVNSLSYDPMLKTIILLDGHSLTIAAFLPILHLFCGVISSIFFFAELYSPNFLTPYIAIFIFLFGIRLENKPNQSQNDPDRLNDLLFDVDLLNAIFACIFGISMLFSGICTHFHSFQYFLIAGLFIGSSIISLPSSFVFTIYFSFFLFIFTFPYTRVNRWKEVFSAWFTYLLIIFLFFILFFPYTSFINNFSLVFNFRLEFWKKLGSVTFICLIMPLFYHYPNSWFRKLHISFFFAVLLISIFSPINISQNQIIIIYLPYASVFGSHIISELLNSTKKNHIFRTIIGMLLFLSCIFPSFILSPIALHKSESFLSNKDNQELGKWVIKHTNKSSLFLYIGPQIDPTVYYAGRQTFMSLDVYKLPLGLDIPKQHRQLFYFISHIDDEKALYQIDPEYYLVHKDTPKFGAMLKIKDIPFWKLVKAVGPWELYQRNITGK